jgi:hypothetical protein
MKLKHVMIMAISAALIATASMLAIIAPAEAQSLPPTAQNAGAAANVRYAFQASNGGFLSAAATSLRSDAQRLGLSEQFRLIPLGGATYAIQTVSGGRYLSASGGGGLIGFEAVTFVPAIAGPNERFTIACTSTGWCGLRTANGYYLAAGYGGVGTSSKKQLTVFRILTPRIPGQATAASPTARAKTGAILGQIAGPIVLGSVGHDRFEAWEDALGTVGPRTGSGYQHLIIAQSQGDGTGPGGILISGDYDVVDAADENAFGARDDVDVAVAQRRIDECRTAKQELAEYEDDARELSALQSVANNVDFFGEHYAKLDAMFVEGSVHPPTDQEALIALAVNVKWEPISDSTWRGFHQAVRDKIGELLATPRGDPSELAYRLSNARRRAVRLEAAMAAQGCLTDCKPPIVAGKYEMTGDPRGVLVIGLQSQGGAVAGHYGRNENALNNSMNGRWDQNRCGVLIGTFVNKDYNTNGRFELTFSASGETFSGSWWNKNNSVSGHNWTGRKK